MSAKEEIHARIADFYEKFNNGKVAEASECYHEDVVAYQPGAMPIVGRAALREVMEKMSTMVKKLEMEKMDHFEQFNDNTAYMMGLGRCLDESGKTVRRIKGCLLWRKIDGAWYIVHDVFNETPL